VKSFKGYVVLNHFSHEADEEASKQNNIVSTGAGTVKRKVGARELQVANGREGESQCDTGIPEGREGLSAVGESEERTIERRARKKVAPQAMRLCQMSSTEMMRGPSWEL